MVMGSPVTVRAPFYTRIQGFRLSDILVERLCYSPSFLLLAPSPITMNTTKSTCPGCHKGFIHRGLAQHIAKTNNKRCHAVYTVFPLQSLLRSYPYEQALLTLTPNSTSWSQPDWTFGSKHLSGHDRTPDSPGLPPLGNVTGNMDDGKLTLRQSGLTLKTYTSYECRCR